MACSILGSYAISGRAGLLCGISPLEHKRKFMRDTVPSDTNKRNVIRLGNLDQPLYRVYALDRFEQLVATKYDALLNPTKWEDPFENFFLEATEVMDPQSGDIISLKNLAADWYGQCWTTLPESDAMWRIYSSDPNKAGADPDKLGVKVKTRARKLFDNLRHTDSNSPYLQFFIGQVDYKTEAEIMTMMQGLTLLDVAIGGQGEKFADLLCIKREAFQHEQEVRLLFQDIDPKRGATKVFKYKLDPNAIFEEVVLDPRLKDYASVQSRLVSAGCTLPISRSPLYQSPHFVIQIQ
jgi:hypothetical protein